jgi:hypothetical protein
MSREARSVAVEAHFALHLSRTVGPGVPTPSPSQEPRRSRHGWGPAGLEWSTIRSGQRSSWT